MPTKPKLTASLAALYDSPIAAAGRFDTARAEVAAGNHDGAARVAAETLAAVADLAGHGGDDDVVAVVTAARDAADSPGSFTEAASTELVERASTLAEQIRADALQGQPEPDYAAAFGDPD